MVWSNIPGANVHRGAEGDNTVQRTDQASVKRSTYPSAFSNSVGARAPDDSTLTSSVLCNYK